ncbi:hypothetical protein ABQZ99_020785 [Xanthomonas hortorum pv. vitians]|uniref:Uncharacterized protein n=2 Tax=Xanthomonas hortorum TaxID=56454 RepID=A0AAW8ZWB7_9XANT|nr:hypothetical protein [Xanthomonas hortorum]MCC8494712.1 hypothetical protein [Xanthomonas hortorum pv. gardneri]MCE4279092.1 hypothetical protein [Xanthomonas hortorum pv. vitians]MCE4308698.1 hypothetical protein [Xanthomonas hortorum pv. vitians]MCE4340550.1 hypothetical protein [Xanthomonas hortorum pv. vitians]MCE4365570.1 hypothetical protein [Xanthomonas hortorum pv. vitians]
MDKADMGVASSLSGSIGTKAMRGVSSLVTAAAQIAPEIDNVRSDAASEMAVGNDLTALGYACDISQSRTQARSGAHHAPARA